MEIKTKVGRNEPCPCGKQKDDGKPMKYKNCCEDLVKAGKKKIVSFSRRDLISGPYKACPSCERTNSFGVFVSIAGSNGYSRECIKCGHSQGYPLPKIKKKVIYLDQFVISNLIKLLDKDHPSHERIKAEPFWEKLYIKLEKASRSQAIICPDSFYHRDESLTGNIDFKLMKRLYEHFSSGKTLYPSLIVEKFQIAKHFESWLEGNKHEFVFDPQDISFERDLHTWDVGLHVSVGGNAYPGQIEELQRVNASTKSNLEQIWKRWAQEKHIKFEDRVKEETLGLGKGLAQAAQQFNVRRNAAMARIAAGEDYDMELNDFMPPMSNEIVESVIRFCRYEKGMSQEEIPETIARYFTDVDALLEVPVIRISSVMFAGWAHLAAMGKKKTPKSSADVQFISSYLPYCDALFVDIESGTILREFPKDTPEYLRLKEFSPRVFTLNEKDRFLDYLDEIVASIPEEQAAILRDMNGENYGEPYWSLIEHEKRETREGN